MLLNSLCISLKVLVLCVLASIVPSVAARSQSPQDAVTLIRVEVTNPTTGTKRIASEGTGFLIDLQGHIITVRHVIDAEAGPKNIMVSLRHRHSPGIPAQIIACEAGNIDLCLIKIPNVTVDQAGIKSWFSLSCRPLRPSERVTSLGYPMGSNNPILTIPGQVTGELATELKYPSNVQIVPGMSGGPVLDEAQKVIASNAGAARLGGEPFPTLTFLQPLLYGEGLMRRANIICLNAPLAPTARRSVWLHNSSKVVLVATGSKRSFIYSEPDPNLADAGVTPGVVLFEGKDTGGRYEGQAYRFSRRCPPRRYHVEGPIEDRGATVKLSGQVRRLDTASCNLLEPYRDDLEFTFLRFE